MTKMITAVCTALVSLTGATPAQHTAPITAVLLADTDHDGEVDARPGAGEAIFLPNLDDSERRCEVSDADLDAPGSEPDVRLAACNDAADARVNGEHDAADLARLRLPAVRGIGEAATGRLSVDAQDKVRIFARQRAGFRPVLPEGDGLLTAAELRSGLEFGVEGRDAVRDIGTWDGLVTITLTVTDGSRRSTSRVRLREAPLLLQNDLQPAVEVLAGKPGTGPGAPPALPFPDGLPGGWDEFSRDLRAATSAAGVRSSRFVAGTSQWWKDTWWQDIFEPTTASMPVPGGVRTMRVLVRSGNVLDLGGDAAPTPRPLGRLLFRDLRGPGVGVVQQLTLTRRDHLTDLRNATGNVESLPPDAGHPLGRLVYGTGRIRRPDPAFIQLLTSMGQGLQPPVVLDTDWLMVGHVDETMHVVRAGNPRGWTLMVADPRLAARLVHRAGDEKLLGDRALMSANARAAEHIDGQIDTMLAATGLRRSEIVRVPVLFSASEVDPSLLKAHTPGIPNGLSLTAHEFAAPDPHGPVAGGRDLFREATRKALASRGVHVRWVEDLKWAHLLGGEVHCATNALRDTRSTARWWI
ncbi:protein-arginine deiminase family protein [Nonomuraea sp. NPDC046802]|uniref:protein-arginine deiminase family protein n=1 Tax=Nonomuraea sp. NPDC046802 TaxID=3154919 RepID=UPI0033D8E60C